MGAVTYFSAMPFIRDDDGDLMPGEAQERISATVAERKAARMATPGGDGAVAFSRTGDLATGEFEDAVVLKASARYRPRTTFSQWTDLSEGHAHDGCAQELPKRGGRLFVHDPSWLCRERAPRRLPAGVPVDAAWTPGL